jgi:Na+-transporting methylmalonyl-CoA/oxaloacetate decarboxylase gamma subunit
LTATVQESYHIYYISSAREANLKDLSFGLTMTFWGMGVTLFTLGLLILIIRLMNRIYPFKEELEDKKKD